MRQFDSTQTAAVRDFLRRTEDPDYYLNVESEAELRERLSSAHTSDLPALVKSLLGMPSADGDYDFVDLFVALTASDSALQGGSDSPDEQIIYRAKGVGGVIDVEGPLFELIEKAANRYASVIDRAVGGPDADEYEMWLWDLGFLISMEEQRVQGTFGGPNES